MPKTLFGNLNSFEIPKVDVITDQHHDTDGELFYSFLVRPCTDKYITYEVSKDGALINKTSNKKQDLLCTLLELPADPSADDIADFISEYGFFLSEFNNNSGRYIRYQEDDIKQIISRNNLRKDEIASELAKTAWEQLEEELPSWNNAVGVMRRDALNDWARTYLKYPDNPVMRDIANEELKTRLQNITAANAAFRTRDGGGKK